MLRLHGHLCLVALVVYALFANVHNLGQIDKLLRRFHDWELHVEANHVINHTLHARL